MTTQDAGQSISYGSRTIRGQEVQTKTLLMEQEKLKFFPDNPRIYTMVHQGGESPAQDEIEAILVKADWVKDLQRQIKENGGVMEPLVVRDGTFEVLEGNSRLAAYRALAKNDPITWGFVKCELLPADIDEALVFALLGQFHLKGKKAWQPFEQAGFLSRRCKNHKLDYKTLGTDIGVGWKMIKLLVETYDFMQTHDEPPERWSYWFEYLRSYKIAKAREHQPNLDTVVLEKVKTEEIAQAQLIRDDLPSICQAPKVLQKFVEGKLDFEAAVETAQTSGADHVEYQRVVKFCNFLILPATEQMMLSSEQTMRQKFAFELAKIEQKAKSLKQKLKDK